MDVRRAHPDEVDHLGKLWFDAWREVHAAIVPPALTRARTLESFRARLADALDDTRVAGPHGAAVGLCVIREDELYQLFVAPSARGSDVAAALLADGEARLAARGIAIAWLACAIGNDRAARFYEKHGWRRARVMESRLDTTEGVILLNVWRYEKAVRTGQA